VGSPARTVTLEIDPGSDPISGRAVVDNQGSRQFDGWLELAAVLQAAHDDGEPEGSPST